MTLKALPEADLSIDKNALDKDAIEQVRLMRIWGRILADARRTTREAKNALAVVTAECRDKIRDSPVKLNVDAVNDALVQMQAYQKALKAYSDAEYEEEVYESYVKALNSRDYAISNLAKLYGHMYWAKDSVDPATRAKYLSDAEPEPATSAPTRTKQPGRRN